MMRKDPDKGPPMMEGAHHYDKGYVSEIEDNGTYPSKEERGNRYLEMQDEIVDRDSAKLVRSKFTKIH